MSLRIRFCRSGASSTETSLPSERSAKLLPLLTRDHVDEGLDVDAEFLGDPEHVFGVLHVGDGERVVEQLSELPAPGAAEPLDGGGEGRENRPAGLVRGFVTADEGGQDAAPCAWASAAHRRVEATRPRAAPIGNSAATSASPAVWWVCGTTSARPELGDARSFSLDSPKSRAPLVAAFNS